AARRRRPGWERQLVIAAVVSFAAWLSACGGGVSQGGGPSEPPPAPNFALTLTPASIALSQGQTAQLTLLATGTNGFSSTVAVTISGLPAGVSASPSTISLSPGQSQQIRLSASGTAAGSGTATVTAAAGSLQHQAQLPVSITAVDTLNTRDRYTRTNAVTEYFQWPNTHWAVYNAATGRFFITDPLGNHVEAMDAAMEREIASIPVPGAYGIDQTADGSELWVGTLIGDVYEIDPAKMAVVHRYIAAQIGPYGFRATQALPLADGSLALLGTFGGMPSVDGSPDFAVWTPATNAITVYAGDGSIGYFGSQTKVPFQPLCGGMQNIGGFALTADRTGILVGSIDSDNHICEYFPATGGTQSIQSGGSFSAGKFVVSPDGRYLALGTGYPSPAVLLYDQKTLALEATLPLNVPAASPDFGADIFFSPDGSTLYVTGSNPALVFAYSIATQQQIGWLPNMVIMPTAGGSVTAGPLYSPYFQAVDSGGLAVGPAEEGVGFLDITALNPLPPPPNLSVPTNAYPSPATGPAGGETTVQWRAPKGGTVYFGRSQSPQASYSAGQIQALTPPGQPGPADVYLFAASGDMQLIPEGFSYGPTILEVTPNMSTADGGGTGVIYGYGFGPDLPEVTPQIPSGLQVTVGGQAATITGWNEQAYNLEIPPFLLQSITYQIPPRAAGPAEVQVTTPAGTATAPAAITYLPATQQFPLPGASLAEGIYDPKTNLYYFTDAQQLQVFSAAQGQWLAPIPVPGAERLWGLSLSPNDSTLAVADSAADVIDLLDPTQPTSVRSIPFQVPNLPQGVIAHPVDVAIADSGEAYVAADIEGGSGFNTYYKLDTSTGAVSAYQDTSGPGPSTELRVALSEDGSRVYCNDKGFVFQVTTATDQITWASADQNCCDGDYDLALAPNQAEVEASSYLYDSQLNAHSFLAMNDYEALGAAYLYGAKFSADGRLLYQPDTQGLDIFDAQRGTLLDRIATPFSLSPAYDALVEDGQDDNLVAITTTGIAILNLSSVPEPAPLPYSEPAVAVPPPARWAQRPSGSQPGTGRAARSSEQPAAPRHIPHITGAAPLRWGISH
ncbi:MAG: IPT/TIG domain-containing protein, partial [Terriglobales bacterium]